MLYKFAVFNVMMKLCIERTCGFELRDSPFIQIAASQKLSRVLVSENICLACITFARIYNHWCAYFLLMYLLSDLSCVDQYFQHNIQ